MLNGFDFVHAVMCFAGFPGRHCGRGIALAMPAHCPYGRVWFPDSCIGVSLVSSSLLAKGTGFWHSVSELVSSASSEEPGAVVPHAGICEGGTG